MAQKIKNVHEKFTERENELRLTIINETVNNGRAFDLEEDKMEVLGKLQMDVKEYKEICEKLLEEDGMVLDGTKVPFHLLLIVSRKFLYTLLHPSEASQALPFCLLPDQMLCHYLLFH